MRTEGTLPMKGCGSRGLCALLVAQFMGAANDNILKALLSFFVVRGMWDDILDEGGQGLIALLLFVPFIIFSGWAGPIADRYSKRRIAIWMKWFELPLAIAAGFGFVTGNFWLTASAMILLATQSTFFSPAKYGMIPELVSEHHISRANGLLNMSTNVAIISGMLVAGIVSVEFQEAVAVMSSDVMFNFILWLPGIVLSAVAVIGIIAIIQLPKLKPFAPSTIVHLNPFSSYIATVREMWGTPLLTGAIAWSLFYLLGTLALLVVLELGVVLDVDDKMVSYLLASIGISIGLGSLTVGFLSKARIRIEFSRYGSVAMVVSLLLAGILPPTYWTMMILLFCLGFSAGFYAVPIQSLMQTLPKPSHRGRVLATSNAISFLFMALGSLAYSLCRYKFEDSPQYIFIACSVIGVAAWYMSKRISTQYSMTMNKSVYLDNNATTSPLPEVTQAVQTAMLKYWGNPSSIHRIGQEARHQVDLAREHIANLIHAVPAEITFTSGGTESSNLALNTACKARPDRNVVVTSKLEHAAVGEMVDLLHAQGMEVVLLDNDSNGVVCMRHLEELLQQRASEIAVVSLMWCNNETGVVEPMEKACALCHEHDVLIHSDATQWVAKMPVDVRAVPIDLMSFAAHKFHGPKGVGALYAKKQIPVAPLVTGGPQERGRRGGTENVPAILGFGVAAQIAATWLTDENISNMIALRDEFERLVVERIPEAHIHSKGAVRAWTTSSISIPNVKGELLLLMLSERGVCASSGSACSSGAFKNSKVIEAIGSPDEGEWGTLRFSFARTTTLNELERAVDALVESLSSIKNLVGSSSKV